MSRYRIKLNGTDIERIGLESANLSLRAGGPDTLALAYSIAAPDAAPFVYRDTVTLTAETLVDEVVTATETLFSGKVKDITEQDDRTQSGYQIQAVNGWDDLRQTILTQESKSYNPTSGLLESAEIPRCLLGQSVTGSSQTTGDIISEIIAKAAAKGANITSGTIGISLNVPTTEVVDTSCDQALRQILAYHPDAVAYISGTDLNIKLPSTLSSVTVDPVASGLKVVKNTRTDRAPVGVQITWEISHQTDGDAVIERRVDSAGATSGWPPPLTMTIPLAGINATYKKSTIETRTLPSADTLTNDSSKNFFKGLIPELADADNSDLGLTGFSLAFNDPKIDEINEDGDAVANPNSRPTSHSGESVDSYPRQLVRGAVEDWFPGNIKQWEATLKARVFYRGSDAEIRKFVGDGITVSEAITITNALPKTYREIDTYEAGEEPIANLASDYWDAIKTAANEGQISGLLAGEFLTLKPGAKVIVSGWFETASVITDFSVDLLTQEFASNYGGSEFLNPRSLTDLARAFQRNKPTWSTPRERTEAKAGSASRPVENAGPPVERFGGPKTTRETLSPWGLIVTDPDAGSVKINVGKIADMTGAYNGALTCSNPTAEFTVANGDLLCIRLAEVVPTSYSLTKESGWPIANDGFIEIDESDEFDFAVFPLWEIVSTGDAETIQIGTTLHARRICPPWHLRAVHTWYQIPDGNRLVVPGLVVDFAPV